MVRPERERLPAVAHPGATCSALVHELVAHCNLVHNQELFPLKELAPGLQPRHAAHGRLHEVDFHPALVVERLAAIKQVGDGNVAQRAELAEQHVDQKGLARPTKGI